MSYAEDAAALPRGLADELAPLRTLEHVLDWLKRRDLLLSSLDLVTQDEYDHDLFLPLPDGTWLAFGVT